MTLPAAREPGDLSRTQLAWALLGFTAVLAFYYAIVEGPGRINHDMSEAYAWGREFQWGYPQHPPFWAWICGLWFLVFPREIEWFGLLSAINAGIGMLGVWMIAGFFVRGPERTAALALSAITPCFSLMAFKYNANIIFISLWPWTLYFFLRSLERRRIVDALGFGAFAGLCLLSKYFAFVLLGVCLLASLLPERRAVYWRSASPYLSMIVALLMFAPHLVWLIENRAPPLQYLATQSGLGASELASYLLNSALGVLVIAAPAAIAVALLAGPRAKPPRGRDPQFRLLAVLALAPLALTFLAALALRTRLYTEMVVGVFPLWTTFCIAWARPAEPLRFERRAVRLALAAAAIFALLAIPVSYATARWSKRSDEIAPLREVTVAAERAWREATGGAPLMFIAGDPATAQAAVFYAAGRPHAFVNFDFARSAWVDPAELAKYGLLSICPADLADCRDRAEKWAGPNAKRLDMDFFHVAWGHGARPQRFRLTITPPAG